MSTSHRLLIFYFFVTSFFMSTNHSQRTYQKSCECEKTVDGKCAYTLVLPLDTGGKSDLGCKGGCLAPDKDLSANVNESLKSLEKGVANLDRWTGDQAKMMISLLNKMTSFEQQETSSSKNGNVSEDFKDLSRNISEQSSRLRKLEIDLEQVNKTMTSLINQIKTILTDDNFTASSIDEDWLTQNNLWNSTASLAMRSRTTYDGSNYNYDGNNISTSSIFSDNFTHNIYTTPHQTSNLYAIKNTTTVTTMQYLNSTNDINNLTTSGHNYPFSNIITNRGQITTYKPIYTMDNITTHIPENSTKENKTIISNLSTTSPLLPNNNTYHDVNNSSTTKQYFTTVLSLDNTFQQLNVTSQQYITKTRPYNSTTNILATLSINETFFDNKAEDKQFITITRVSNNENNTKQNSSEWATHNYFQTTTSNPHLNETGRSNITLTTTDPHNELSHIPLTVTTYGRNIFVDQTSSTNHIQLSSEPHIYWTKNDESGTSSQPSWKNTNQSANRIDKNTISVVHEVVATTQLREYNNTFDRNDAIDYKQTTRIPSNTNLFTFPGSAHNHNNIESTLPDPNIILKRKKRDFEINKSALPDEIPVIVNSLILRIVDLESKLKLWEGRGRYLCSKRGSFLTNNKARDMVSASTKSSGILRSGKTEQSNNWCIDSPGIGQSIRFDFTRDENIFGIIIRITSGTKGFFYISYADNEQVWNVYAGPEGKTQIFTVHYDGLDHYHNFELWQPITSRSIKIHPIDDTSQQRLCFSVDFIGCMD